MLLTKNNPIDQQPEEISSLLTPASLPAVSPGYPGSQLREDRQPSKKHVNPKFTICQHSQTPFRVFFSFSQKFVALFPFFCLSVNSVQFLLHTQSRSPLPEGIRIPRGLSCGISLREYPVSGGAPPPSAHQQQNAQITAAIDKLLCLRQNEQCSF